jgi:ATP-dependent DNA ligase
MHFAPWRRCASVPFVGTTSRLPKWIKPQLTRLVDEAPTGDAWLHEIKYDGYRMHARIDSGKATLLTRTGLDWSHRYRRTIEALRELPVRTAYLDGELCALNADGVLVVEVTYLTWTGDNLLRQVSYQGQREDKPARQWCERSPILLGQPNPVSVLG